MIKHHLYDGLGRLVKTQSPFPEPGSSEYPGLVRSERFYYDGIRRIQELVTDPVLNQGAAGQSGDPELENLAGQGEQGGDPEGAPVPLEEGQLEGDPEQGGGAQGWTPNAVLAREYIWGPGDSYAGVDELLVQFGEDRKPYWAIQDGGGDVVAVVKAPGSSPSSTQPAKICGQWTYDAYGAVQSFDLLANHPVVHCGHKGLFFDRLDVGVVTVGGGGVITEEDRLEPGAELSGYARNRHYSPRHGRWLQMDPNATALAVLGDAGWHGGGLSGEVAVFDINEHFRDGLNTYGYTASSPWTRHDGLGLFLGSLMEALITGWDLADTADDMLAQARQGVMLQIYVYRMITGYSSKQAEYVDWATNWSESDDWGGASGGDFILGTDDFNPGIGNAPFGPLPGVVPGTDVPDDADVAAAKGSGGGPGGGILDAFNPARKHGSTPHWEGMYKQFKKVKKTLKPAGIKPRRMSVRTNQALRDAQGNIVRVNGRMKRPDVQFIGSNGKVYVIEVGASQSKSALLGMEDTYKKALGDQFGGYFPLKVE